jgi:hypothetical protein
VERDKREQKQKKQKQNKKNPCGQHLENPQAGSLRADSWYSSYSVHYLSKNVHLLNHDVKYNSQRPRMFNPFRVGGIRAGDV